MSGDTDEEAESYYPCPACVAGKPEECEPLKGYWEDDVHFRPDLYLETPWYVWPLIGAIVTAPGIVYVVIRFL